MEKSRLELKVGLFVFICIVLLAALVVQFSKGTSLFASTYTLKLHAPNVGGLKQNAGVLLAGVGVGDVQHIELEPSGTNVTITLRIYDRFHIYHDARFVIEANGFLGDQYVSVVPTENTLPLLTNGEDVECEAPFNLQEVARGAAGLVTRLDDTAKKLDSSVTDLRDQVLNNRILANLGSSATNLKVITEQAVGTLHDLRAIVDTNSSQVTDGVSNFVQFSSQLPQLGISISNMLATNADNLTAATKNLRDITDDVKAGKGLAGTLLQDPVVAANVESLAENLAEASSNLNRYGLWHFLWAHPPARSETNAVKPVTLESPPSRK